MKQRYISAQKDPPHPNLKEGEGSAVNCKLIKLTLNYYLLSLNSQLSIASRPLTLDNKQ